MFLIQGCYDKALVYLEQHFTIITIVTGSVPLLLVSRLFGPGEGKKKIEIKQGIGSIPHNGHIRLSE